MEKLQTKVRLLLFSSCIMFLTNTFHTLPELVLSVCGQACFSKMAMPFLIPHAPSELLHRFLENVGVAFVTVLLVHSFSCDFCVTSVNDRKRQCTFGLQLLASIKWTGSATVRSEVWLPHGCHVGDTT